MTVLKLLYLWPELCLESGLWAGCSSSGCCIWTLSEEEWGQSVMPPACLSAVCYCTRLWTLLSACGGGWTPAYFAQNISCPECPIPQFLYHLLSTYSTRGFCTAQLARICSPCRWSKMALCGLAPHFFCVVSRSFQSLISWIIRGLL